MPIWSHDGKQIAFASDRYGNFDVFVMPATGGEARRLTFHSAPEYPYAFSPDDKYILFGAARFDSAVNRLFPTGAQPELYQAPAGGGRVEQLLTTPAEDVKLSRNGQSLIYHDRKGFENAWRKHHTSAIARDIWIYDTKAGTHRKITTFAGEDRKPVFTDDDRELPRQLRRLTGLGAAEVPSAPPWLLQPSMEARLSGGSGSTGPSAARTSAREPGFQP